MSITPIPLTPDNNQDPDPGFPAQVPDQSPVAPSDDGNFTHPAFQGIPQSYDVAEIAKGLFEDAGIEWPGQLPGLEGINTNPSVNGQPDPQQSQQSQQQTQILVPPPPPELVTIGDKQVPLEQANAMLAWHEYLSTNPDKAQEIANVINPQSQPPQLQVQQPTQPVQPTPAITPPPEFDADDPVQKFMLDQLGTVAQTLSTIQRQQQEQIHQAAITKANSEMRVALDQFKSSHSYLSDAEVDQVRQVTASLNIVGGLVESSSDPVVGITKALEIGLYQVPSTRDKAIAQLGQTPPVQSPNKDEQRQRQLTSLAGTTGSTPRTEPKPRLDNDHDMKQELVKAFEPYFANR